MEAQPVTYTRDTSSARIASILDARAADHPARCMTIPEDYVFFARITLSIASICAQLGVTHNARSIYDDMDGAAAAVTPVGRRHDTWVRLRELPYGLEPHDHP